MYGVREGLSEKGIVIKAFIHTRRHMIMNKKPQNGRRLSCFGRLCICDKIKEDKNAQS